MIDNHLLLWNPIKILVLRLHHVHLNQIVVLDLVYSSETLI